MDQEEFDFVAIGDITTDAFIRIKEAEVNCDVDKANCKISMRFGDKIPYESVTIVPAVGNSPNAAVSAARLGLKSALISNLGADYNGEEALQTLQKEKVDSRFVTKHEGKKTNYHYVLWYQDDRTILIKHEEYDYQLPFDFAQGKPPKWMYLSSLGENSLPFQHEVAKYVSEHPTVKLAFQPGTFQIKSSDELRDVYAVTEVFFCNVEEAKKILKQPDAEIKNLLEGIAAWGPKIVVITDGARGAYAYQNGETTFMPPYPDPKPPVDRTGAGDSFASTFTAALALGKTVPEALAWGPINSMSVVQQIGAQAGLLTRPELEKYLAEAPSGYLARKI